MRFDVGSKQDPLRRIEALSALNYCQTATNSGDPMETGHKLGPYEIVEQIGKGGMGEVYLAQDTRLGRTVAIKVLPAEFAGDPERLARFEQEARAASTR